MRGSLREVPADGPATGDEGPFPRRDRHRVTQAGEMVGG